MGYTSKAAAVTPPVIGQNIWGLDADDVTPTTWIAVPDSWKDAIMRFEAQGEDFYFVFGDSDLTAVVAGNASTIAANAISVQGSVAYHLEANSFIDFDLSLVDKVYLARMALVGADGTADNILRITRTSGYVRKT